MDDDRTPLFAWTQYRDDPDSYERDFGTWLRDGTWERAAGIGVLTEFCGLMCVDVDVPFEDAFAHLSRVTGVPVTSADIPHGLVKTQSGRCHIWFRVPDGEVGRGLSAHLARKIGLSGIEVKHPGVCVPLPPSRTSTGQYEWIHRPYSMDDISRALLARPHPFVDAIYAKLDAHEADQERIRQEQADVQEQARREHDARIRTAKASGRPVRLQTPVEEQARALAYQAVIDPVYEGHRHDAQVRLAGSVCAAGFSEHALAEALTAYNKRCSPPLPDDELDRILRDSRKWIRHMPREVVDETQDGIAAVPAAGAAVRAIAKDKEHDVTEMLEPLALLPDDAAVPEIAEALRRIGSDAEGCDPLRKVALREAVCAAVDRFQLRAPTALVDAALETAAEDYGTRQGQSMQLTPPEPWPEPVDGATLLDELTGTFGRFLSLPEGAAVVLALWTVHAHAIEAFDVSPRLAVTSATKRCGKSTVLKVVRGLIPKPVSTANITAQALFRTIEKYGPTILLDEADRLLVNRDDLYGLLDAGHERGVDVIRLVGDRHEPRSFRVFGPAAIAMIGRLESTLADRSVEIRMLRRKTIERVERFRLDRQGEMKTLCRKAARWARDNVASLRAADPIVPSELHDRAADNWRPLFAIADLAGGDWPASTRRAARQLSGAESEDEEDGVQLLADIRAVFHTASTGPERIASAALVQELVLLEDRPWSEWKGGRPMTIRQLARKLSEFEIGPKQMRVEGQQLRGYERGDFEDSWRRYLPDEEEVQTVTPSQH